MRAERKKDWSDIPSRETTRRAHSAAVCMERKNQDCQDGGSMGQFRNCKVWGDAGFYGRGPVSGSADMSDTRRNSNYSKWETMQFTELRKASQDQLILMGNVSLYKMDGNKLDDLVCVKHSQRWILDYFSIPFIHINQPCLCGWLRSIFLFSSSLFLNAFKIGLEIKVDFANCNLHLFNEPFFHFSWKL